VKHPDDGLPKVDIYIDDKFMACLEYDIELGSTILPFILHVLGREVHHDEPLACDDILSEKSWQSAN
jgi:hypothetical protein